MNLLGDHRVQLALVFVGGVVGGYAGGRWAAPTRVQVVEHTEYVDKWHVREVEKKVVVEGPVRWRTIIKTVQGPEGPERIVIREVEKGPSTTTTDTTTDGDGITTGEITLEKVVERDAPRVTLLGTVGLDVGNLSGPPVWGGQVQARVVGPLVLGVGFDSSLRATVTAGLTF